MKPLSEPVLIISPKAFYFGLKKEVFTVYGEFLMWKGFKIVISTHTNGEDVITLHDMKYLNDQVN